MARRVNRRVNWTEPAWKDLEQIADFIASDSPQYAAVFVREVREAVRSLKFLALRGRQVREFEDPTIRQLIVQNAYRLIYKVDDRCVYVLAIIHGARDLLALWQKRGS